MSDILRQLTANLIPTVSGGAYQDAREVSIVWNTRRKHRFLPKFRCRMHQTRPSTLFSPVFSLAREKIGPPEARQKRPRRNEPPQATSLILCARFFLSKPQTEFAARGACAFPMPSPMRGRWHGEAETDEVEAPRFATLATSSVCSASLRSQLPLIGGAFVRCGGVQSLSRLRRQLPLHKGALGCARKKPSLRRKAQKRPRRKALLSGPVTENSEHHTPRAAARRTARPAPGQSRRCGRP